MKTEYHRDEIKKYLIQLKEKELKNLEQVAGTYAGDADLDEEAVIDADDLSHQSQSTEAARNAYAQLGEARRQLEEFRKMDPEDPSVVSQGTIVITNQVNFVTGLSFKDFEWKGEHFVGISTEAPVFSVLAGKRAGDAFRFKGVDYVIEQIL